MFFSHNNISHKGFHSRNIEIFLIPFYSCIILHCVHVVYITSSLLVDILSISPLHLYRQCCIESSCAYMFHVFTLVTLGSIPRNVITGSNGKCKCNLLHTAKFPFLGVLIPVYSFRISFFLISFFIMSFIEKHYVFLNYLGNRDVP